jgi:hypothetical protein
MIFVKNRVLTVIVLYGKNIMLIYQIVNQDSFLKKKAMNENMAFICFWNHYKI